MKKLILASKSPRRHEILLMAGYDHEVRTSDADETVTDEMSAAEASLEFSRRKAFAVLNGICESAVIIAADTLVEVGGKIYGKPKNEEDARGMLLSMSGGDHLVHTGITVTDGEKTVSETVTTRVWMRRLASDEIDGYIFSKEPFDKAGAYGIQGPAGAFVEKLEGDYFNVMGLPLCRVSEILRDFGIGLFDK